MKKISLAVIGCFFHLFSIFAQTDSKDTSAYQSRKLKLEEVNFVSGYYHQDGNNSAVTGGIGTENLTDFANTLDVLLLKPGTKGRQYSWNFELGIDHYTSASSDKIDPNTVSSPSYSDTRIYPSVGWSEKNSKGTSFGLDASFSTEFDYKSFGLGAHFIKTSKDNNKEFSARLQTYFDRWTLIYPIELRPPGGGFSGHESNYAPRNSYSASFAYSFVVNRRLQLAALLDLISQKGLLATDYQRVYFIDGSERIENLPGDRFKIPVGVRANIFLNDRFIFRTWYRYYSDNWGVKAHALSIEMPVKLNVFTSISPFYRYYTQTAANYFAPYAMHVVSETFYTSDYDLSALNSSFFGVGVRFAPEKGVFNVKHWTTVELRYGHYARSTGLNADIISLSATFK